DAGGAGLGAGGGFHRHFDQPRLFLQRERGRLSAGGVDEQAVRALLDLPLDQFRILVVIYFAAIERHDKRRECPFQKRNADHNACLNACLRVRSERTSDKYPLPFTIGQKFWFDTARHTRRSERRCARRARLASSTAEV